MLLPQLFCSLFFEYYITTVSFCQDISKIIYNLLTVMVNCKYSSARINTFSYTLLSLILFFETHISCPLCCIQSFSTPCGLFFIRAYYSTTKWFCKTTLSCCVAIIKLNYLKYFLFFPYLR